MSPDPNQFYPSSYSQVTLQVDILLCLLVQVWYLNDTVNVGQCINMQEVSSDIQLQWRGQAGLQC